MIEPPINSLMNKVDSRYTLVVATAKRARQLAEGAHKMTKCDSDKPVTVAIHEIDENKITYVRTRNSIK
jgi:DNA-directed RNA polymerase subunit omega